MRNIAVRGLACDGCEDIVETAVSEVRGVESVSADYKTGEVEYAGDAEQDEIVEAIEFAGYDIANGN